MILLWVTLLVLHQGYTLVPVTTVQLGEPVTLTCDLPNDEFNDRLYWYKQSAGETLKLIVRLRKHVNPVYGPEFSASRLDVNISNKISSLTILRTIQEDEGMYHCTVLNWLLSMWRSSVLYHTGNTQRTSNYAVVQWPTVSDPVHPGASMSLQCSVLSDSEKKMCPGDHSVFWFRAGSDQSHPDIIYTDGNRRDECDRNSDIQKSCVYRFSKNISSSDAGTYYCAVATCGQILFGDGTKVEIEGTSTCSQNADALIFLLCAVLAISLTVIAVLVYTIKKNKSDCGDDAVAVQRNLRGQKSQQKDEDTQVYSAVVFTVMKTGSGAIKDSRAAGRQRIYAAVKAFGLD
ncbi:uncharacterized protein LOC144463865 [Epinephelus lanceolatus]